MSVSSPFAIALWPENSRPLSNVMVLILSFRCTVMDSHLCGNDAVDLRRHDVSGAVVGGALGKKHALHTFPLKLTLLNCWRQRKEYLHTITFDNDKEFMWHAQIRERLGTENYFVHPFCSWELCLNENHNGLVRQYLPKDSGLDKVTIEEITLI